VNNPVTIMGKITEREGEKTISIFDSTGTVDLTGIDDDLFTLVQVSKFIIENKNINFRRRCSYKPRVSQQTARQSTSKN
jgi:hypothetical protein